MKENQPLKIVVSAFQRSLHAVNLICNYHSKQDLIKDLKEGNAVALQVLQSSSNIWSVMGGSIELLHWEYNKIMKNNPQTNCKLAVQYQVRIIMRVVHGTNVNLLLFDIPKQEVEARRKITHSEWCTRRMVFSAVLWLGAVFVQGRGQDFGLICFWDDGQLDKSIN